MADAKYNSFKGDVQKGLINLGSGGSTIHCMLVTATYVPNIDTHTNVSNITNEVVGTGYTAGGKALTTKSVTVNTTTDLAMFDADDVVWATSTITARGAVLYKITTGELIAYFDFVTDKISTAGDFTVQWNASGILTIA
jgi:hypothetical protein